LLNVSKPENNQLKKQLDAANDISSCYLVPSLSNLRFDNKSYIITIRSVCSCLTIVLCY